MAFCELLIKVHSTYSYFRITSSLLSVSNNNINNINNNYTV
jgi:hypothetical protein